MALPPFNNYLVPLDNCSQCANNPFKLCDVGHSLLNNPAVPAPPERPGRVQDATEEWFIRAKALICHAKVADGRSCREKYGQGSWCSACLGHEAVERLASRPALGPQDEEHETLTRLQAFIRANQVGGCKILSLGDKCICPLCDVERLMSVSALRGAAPDS